MLKRLGVVAAAATMATVLPGAAASAQTAPVEPAVREVSVEASGRILGPKLDLVGDLLGAKKAPAPAPANTGAPVDKCGGGQDFGFDLGALAALAGGFDLGANKGGGFDLDGLAGLAGLVAGADKNAGGFDLGANKGGGFDLDGLAGLAGLLAGGINVGGNGAAGQAGQPGQVVVNQVVNQGAPVQVAPVKAYPVQAYPVQAAAVKAYPVQAAAVKAYPVKKVGGIGGFYPYQAALGWNDCGNADFGGTSAPTNTGAPLNTGIPVNTGVAVNTGVPVNTGAPLNTGVAVNTGVPLNTGVAVDKCANVPTGLDLGALLGGLDLGDKKDIDLGGILGLLGGLDLGANKGIDLGDKKDIDLAGLLGGFDLGDKKGIAVGGALGGNKDFDLGGLLGLLGGFDLGANKNIGGGLDLGANNGGGFDLDGLAGLAGLLGGGINVGGNGAAGQPGQPGQVIVNQAVQAAPVKAFPVQAAPVKAFPVQAAPIKGYPVKKVGGLGGFYPYAASAAWNDCGTADFGGDTIGGLDLGGLLGGLDLGDKKDVDLGGILGLLGGLDLGAKKDIGGGADLSGLLGLLGGLDLGANKGGGADLGGLLGGFDLGANKGGGVDLGGLAGLLGGGIAIGGNGAPGAAGQSVVVSGGGINKAAPVKAFPIKVAPVKVAPFKLPVVTNPVAAGNGEMVGDVMVSVSCLAGNGRVDTNIVNHGEAAATYVVEFGNLTPRQRFIDSGDWGRIAISGRQDGVHSVVVTRNDAVIMDSTVTVSCDSDMDVSDAEVSIVNSCRAGNGYLLYQFVNSSDDARPYVIEFDNVPNRSVLAQGHGAAVRAVTGRPDGTYGYTVRTGSTIIEEGTVDISC